MLARARIGLHIRFPESVMLQASRVSSMASRLGSASGRRFVSTPSFQIFRDVPELRSYRSTLRNEKCTVGLVPTMGALHEGHISLVRLAARETDAVVVSIYVNPTQFGVNEDLSTYPRTWESDIATLEALNAELSSSTDTRGQITAVFAPTTRTMYPTLPPSSERDGAGSFVIVAPLGGILEGASRPVFFRGVATVCMKLFNIVAPDAVYFGQKDFQQTAIIRRMVTDFHIDTKVRIGPTVRDADGLALSSRNVYLGVRRRAMATALAHALGRVEASYAGGVETSRQHVLAPALEQLLGTAYAQDAMPPSERARFEVDYFSLADPDSLEAVSDVDPAKGAVVSGAIVMEPVEEPSEGEDCGLGGGTGIVRLIDNVILRPSSRFK